MQTWLHELSRGDRRRLEARSVLPIVLTTGLLLAFYALVPVPIVPAAETLVRLFVVLLALAGVIAVQVRSVVSANYPELRAIEGLATAITVFLVSFALFYLGLTTVDPAHFSRPLTRVSAFYFTVTVLATVGFGDITAQSDVAQLIVTVQMLLDLVLIAVVVRVFSAAARAGATRREAGRGPGSR